MEKQWICTVCNYIHEGEKETLPEKCPKCKLGKEKFKEIK